MIQGWVGYGLDELGLGWIRIELIRIGLDTDWMTLWIGLDIDWMNQGWVGYGLDESGLGQTMIGSIRIGLNKDCINHDFVNSQEIPL